VYNNGQICETWHLSIGYSVLGNVFVSEYIFNVVSGSFKSFVARHAISSTITSIHRESQTVEKKLEMDGNLVRMEIL